ncbi:MAG: hypothetical protein VX320_05825 [Candidatus Thermoplasmatota archaeon]|nr:hypothetical protein [Candidatus Thermoplasmatota archaeon]MEE3083582.1 hypothetical protein [Candidatus Thermoplasmatota archaeon]
MQLPETSIPPRHILTSKNRTILIGSNGGIAQLHPLRLTEIDAPRRPFSGEISQAVLLGDNLLAATWIEREIGIARMALLDLNEPLQDGPTLLDLREASDQNRLNSHQVAGAIWSHILSAEPLAICAHESSLVFCTHNSGIYRVTENSAEIWRRKELNWAGLEDLPDGNVIAELVSVGESIWAFSIGGGWAEMDAEDGEVIQRGIIQFGAKVERVWHDSGEWIIGLSHQRIAFWKPATNQLLLEQSNGPIQDALRTEEGWLITGWREDLLWKNGQLYSSPRHEIGLHIMDHPEHGLIVLDNCNRWSKFLHSKTEDE